MQRIKLIVLFDQCGWLISRKIIRERKNPYIVIKFSPHFFLQINNFRLQIISKTKSVIFTISKTKSVQVTVVCLYTHKERRGENPGSETRIKERLTRRATASTSKIILRSVMKRYSLIMYTWNPCCMLGVGLWGPESLYHYKHISHWSKTWSWMEQHQVEAWSLNISFCQRSYLLNNSQSC